MPVFVEADVVEVLAVRRGIQKLRVHRRDGGPGDRAYALTQLIGDAEPGDVVVINTTAVELELGTGGWHFVHWNLARKGLSQPGSGHQIKLRYTSVQFDTGTVEELPEYEAPESLDGLPVVCCQLLSQAAVAILAYKAARPSSRVTLVMTDDNALPIAMSDLISDLHEMGAIDTTITAGQAFGGDFEAVTTMSALAAAKSVTNADVVFVTQGPGSLGTGSRFGFSTLGIAAALDDVDWYGGTPILAVRYSEGDARDRHRGVSHHTLTILDRARRAIVPVPDHESTFESDGHEVVSVPVGDVDSLLTAAGLKITTMGRSIEQDRLFFHYAAAAGIAAANGKLT